MTADTSVNRTCRNTVVVLITSGRTAATARIWPATTSRRPRARS
jgi:hypothetical protein